MERHSAYYFCKDFREKFVVHLSREGFNVSSEGEVCKRRSKYASGKLVDEYLVVFDGDDLTESPRIIREGVSRLTRIAEEWDPYKK